MASNAVKTSGASDSEMSDDPTATSLIFSPSASQNFNQRQIPGLIHSDQQEVGFTDFGRHDSVRLFRMDSGLIDLGSPVQSPHEHSAVTGLATSSYCSVGNLQLYLEDRLPTSCSLQSLPRTRRLAQPSLRPSPSGSFPPAWRSWTCNGRGVRQAGTPPADGSAEEPSPSPEPTAPAGPRPLNSALLRTLTERLKAVEAVEGVCGTLLYLVYNVCLSCECMPTDGQLGG